MTLVNRPLFLHPRVLSRTGHPVVFIAEPGPGSDVLEEDAATLFVALEPLIEVLNLAGYELLGAAWSPNATASEPVTYVSFVSLLARADHSTWDEVVGVTIPSQADSALALQVEPRIASGYTPPLADPAELTYALGLRVTAEPWVASRQPLSTVQAGWLVHVPDHAVGTLGAAVDALGPTRPRRGKRWITSSDLGALVSDLSLQVFESWNADGGGGMLRALLPSWWEESPFQQTAAYLTHHLERELVVDDGRFNDRIDIDGTDAERGEHFADVLSWTLGDVVGWIEAIFMRSRKLYGEDLVTLYGEGPFAAALAEAADRFGRDPLLVDLMVLMSTGMLSLKTRDPRWYVDPAPGSPRIGEEPFPAPIEPSWWSTDVTGFYQIVTAVPNVTIPVVPYGEPGTTQLDRVFGSISIGVEMLQVNQAGSYLECQWQGRSPNLTTDWDGDGVAEVHRIGVVHGTISAEIDLSSDPASPAYNGFRRMPAATTPGGTDVINGVRLQFEVTAAGNMTCRLTAVDEDWMFTRQRHRIGDEIVDINRPHLADLELRSAPVASRGVLWGADRAPMHTCEHALLVLIAQWIVDRIDEVTAVFSSTDAEEQIVLGVPALMSYFGTEQHPYAAVQLHYLLDRWPYFGGILGSIFGDEQNYWQALLVAIHELGTEQPALLAALGITQADIDAVVAEHHRYEFLHGTATPKWAATAAKLAWTIRSKQAAKAAWEVIQLGVKAAFKGLALAKTPVDVDPEIVQFEFNKLRLKNPSNPGSDYEPDDNAPGYPATLYGLQVTLSAGLAIGARWYSSNSTVIKTGREQWSPTDWAGPYLVLQLECGASLLFLEDIPNPVSLILNQLGIFTEEGASAGFIFFYRYPQGATVPEAAWSFSPLSMVESTGAFINVISVGIAGGWLCEDVSTGSAEEFFGAMYECVLGAQGELPPLIEEHMVSGAALTTTASCFLANASVIHDDEGLDALGDFLAHNLHAFRRGVGSLLVHGHASPDGSQLHNRCLSERRVEYVERLIASTLGRDFFIDLGRIEGLGLGESVSADVSDPNDPTWRVVELAINRAGMRMMVEQAP
ncbi:MAG: hypothetical protein ABWZ42_01565 [Ilumatobacteraceae bacterium]